MKTRYPSINKAFVHLVIMFLAGIFLTTSPVAANNKIRTYQLTGYAYEIKTGKYVYAERHTEYYKNSKHLYSIVNYVDARGKRIAQKRIDFQSSTIAPDFKTIDLRTGYTEGAKKIDSKSFKLFSKEDQDNPFKSKTIDVNPRTVIDGGFDYFIRNNRDSLLAGQALSIEFPVASRTTTFNFNIRKSKTTVYNKQQAHQITMSIDNRLLGLLLDPISVFYDTRTWRLLGYSGLSNISDENGDGYKVNIVYKYSPDDPVVRLK